MPPNEQIHEHVLPEAVEDPLKTLDIPGFNDYDEEHKDSEFNMSAEEYNEKVINKPFLQRTDIKWGNLYFMVVLHAIALYGFLTYPYFEKKMTFVWGWFLAIVANFGVAGGVHRLWSHRAFKAKVPLKIIFILSYLTSGQYSAIWWARDHRIHHKFSETDADPVNAARGFWFSHVGWLCMKRHPEVLKKAKQLDLSDILNDPVIKFEEKHFQVLRLIFAFIIPTLVPVYFWNESWYWAILSQCFMRYAYSLNCTWGINSFAHMFGNHPYDKHIEPAENFIMTLATGGEGWHNYHHVFPADYKASELGFNYITNVNLTTCLIDLAAKIGWAYDLKEPSEKLLKAVIKNRGDGSHPISHEPVKTK
ncbi:stearoyl-CoA desaturase 5 [Nasonia vitripennis]|uniref:Fatty acid desaturase domain-containing protein n=1 Tax=Nasonia vitripennis TaxID=7425 RepID=A0A7M7G262_NASVI|nr:stearoyl-CoA desaturase 5 [Nasonia vitripennis]XP_003425246.1 stearoyl-CoA desaturase 5 [Nasonia vitripennis]